MKKKKEGKKAELKRNRSRSGDRDGSKIRLNKPIRISVEKKRG
jgi:hypothetical protein